jgi:hypothetical protein
LLLHKFYGIEWDKIYEQMYQPPLVPFVEDPSDSKNYADYTVEDTADISVTSPVTPDMFAGF